MRTAAQRESLVVGTASVEEQDTSPRQEWEAWSGSLAMSVAPVLGLLLILSHVRKSKKLVARLAREREVTGARD